MNIVKELIENHGYTVGRLADLVGSSCRSVERWRDGEVPPWRVFQKQLEKILRRARAKKQVEGTLQPARD